MAFKYIAVIPVFRRDGTVNDLTCGRTFDCGKDLTDSFLPPIPDKDAPYYFIDSQGHLSYYSWLAEASYRLKQQ